MKLCPYKSDCRTETELSAFLSPCLLLNTVLGWFSALLETSFPGNKSCEGRKVSRSPYLHTQMAMRSQQAFLVAPFFLSIPVMFCAKISKTLNCPHPPSFSVASLFHLLPLIMSWASPDFLYTRHHLWCLAACPKLGTCCSHQLIAQAEHRCRYSFPTIISHKTFFQKICSILSSCWSSPLTTSSTSHVFYANKNFLLLFPVKAMFVTLCSGRNLGKMDQRQKSLCSLS